MSTAAEVIARETRPTVDRVQLRWHLSVVEHELITLARRPAADADTTLLLAGARDEVHLLCDLVHRAGGHPTTPAALGALLLADAPTCPGCTWPVIRQGDRLSGWCSVCSQYTRQPDPRLPVDCSTCRRPRSTGLDLCAGYCRRCQAVTDPATAIHPYAAVFDALGVPAGAMT